METVKGPDSKETRIERMVNLYQLPLLRLCVMYLRDEEQAKDAGISEEEKAFIADFYKYSFVGLMLDWIRQGMSADYRQLVEKISTTMRGNIANSIRNFAAGG